MKHGKKYTDNAKLIDRNIMFDPADALELAVKTGTAKFDETVEVHLRLGVDSRHADQQVRGAVVLPNGTGKSSRVAVFAKGEEAKAAEEAGAEVVGAEDLVTRVQEGFMDFDVAIAAPNMMGLVGRLGRFLGPRGLMPSHKAGTVTNEVAKAVEEAKAGKIEYRLDKSNISTAPSVRFHSGLKSCKKTLPPWLMPSLRQNRQPPRASMSVLVPLHQPWGPVSASTPPSSALSAPPLNIGA